MAAKNNTQHYRHAAASRDGVGGWEGGASWTLVMS